MPRTQAPNSSSEAASRSAAWMPARSWSRPTALTSTLVPELEPAVWPVRGQVLVTEPLEERLFAQPHYSRGGYDYWQQLPEGRLLVGGKRDTSFLTENTDVEETTPLIEPRLEQFVVELVGRLPEITHRWAGVWGTTRDLLPLAGQLPGRPGVWVARGYSGHGNVLGFACGHLVGRAILGDEAPELDLFDPARLMQTYRSSWGRSSSRST
jgi:gamma-glutamylputrescine oxidase